MTLLLYVRNLKNSNEWTESYDRPEITDQAAADKWASSLIDWYNSTTKPGEAKRKLLKVELIGASAAHSWYKRTDGMSVDFRGAMVDLYACTYCEVTGKRRMHSSTVKRDSKYRTRKFEKCRGT